MSHIIKITACFQIKNNNHKKILISNSKSQFFNNYSNLANNKAIIIKTCQKGNKKKIHKLLISVMQIIIKYKIFNNNNY